MQDELKDWLLIHYGQENMRKGLSRIREAIDPLKPFFQNTKVVITAGTNGKGETTLRLSKLLKEHSHFIWTSPHIERITERFRDERGEIDVSYLRQLILECHQEVQSKKFDLSFYEFLFFVFCTWAAKKPPAFLLLEVGLGGRLDAVNIFDAQLVLLPSISRDHQEILGNRYDLILKEKLGTLRRGAQLISFLPLKYLRERASQEASFIGAEHMDLEDEIPTRPYHFSFRNQILASAAFCHLLNRPFADSIWNKPVEFLENRGEIYQNENEWHFFGSHNTDGLRKLIQFLHSETYNFSKPPFDSVIVALSKRSVRDLTVMIKMLKASGLGNIILTDFPHPKAASAEVIEALSKSEGMKFVKDVKSYVQGWNNSRVLVTGSYYFLGYIKSIVRR